MREDDENFSIDVECTRETEKAILVIVSVGGTLDEFWIPKSQIHDDSEVFELGGKGTLVVSRWIAEQKGWT